MVIDGHKFGFCKLIADRNTAKILGCHIIGERAVDIAEVAAITIAAGMRVDDLARIPFALSYLRRDPGPHGCGRGTPT